VRLRPVAATHIVAFIYFGLTNVTDTTWYASVGAYKGHD
jgi:hypothetical protein